MAVLDVLRRLFGWRPSAVTVATRTAFPATVAAEVCRSLAENPRAWKLVKAYFAYDTYIVHAATDLAVRVSDSPYGIGQLRAGLDSFDLSSWERRAVRRATSKWLAWYLRTADWQLPAAETKGPAAGSQ